jgi:hypothetical protein
VKDLKRAVTERWQRVALASTKQCRRAVVLISSSSAGQSAGMSEVYQHLILERARLQPYEAA